MYNWGIQTLLRAIGTPLIKFKKIRPPDHIEIIPMIRHQKVIAHTHKDQILQ